MIMGLISLCADFYHNTRFLGILKLQGNLKIYTVCIEKNILTAMLAALMASNWIDWLKQCTFFFISDGNYLVRYKQAESSFI